MCKPAKKLTQINCADPAAREVLGGRESKILTAIWYTTDKVTGNEKDKLHSGHFDNHFVSMLQDPLSLFVSV